MEDLVYAPHQEELLTIEAALQDYKSSLEQSSPDVLETERALCEELNARRGFKINLLGFPRQALIPRDPDANGQPRPHLTREIHAEIDEGGVPQPRLYAEKRILSVDPWAGELTIAGLYANSPHFIVPLSLIESIEVTEPLEA